VQTLGITYFGVVVEEWRNEVIFPWENDNDQFYLLMVNMSYTQVVTTIIHPATP
jgi:hypothetical protein